MLKQIYDVGANMEPCWMSSKVLGLSGDLAMEWESNTKILYDACIVLSMDCDQLVWAANKHSGGVSLKLAYLVLLKQHWETEHLWWHTLHYGK